MGIPSSVGAVVFDFDGLLADTESAWHAAEAAVFAAHGHVFTADDRADCTGRTADGVAAVLQERFGLGPEHRGALQAELLAAVDGRPCTPRPMPGAVALVRALAGRVPLGIATNSSRAALEANLSAIGLRPWFDVVVTADDVGAPKPDPSCYLDAFRALVAHPRDGVVLEDSEAGAAAGRASGAFLITVPPDGRARPAGDHVARSLAAPELMRWARSVRLRTALAPVAG